MKSEALCRELRMITALINNLQYTEEGLCLLLRYHKSVTQLRLLGHNRKLGNEAEKSNGKREEPKITKRKKKEKNTLSSPQQGLPKVRSAMTTCLRLLLLSLRVCL